MLAICIDNRADKIVVKADLISSAITLGSAPKLILGGVMNIQSIP